MTAYEQARFAEASTTRAARRPVTARRLALTAAFLTVAATILAVAQFHIADINGFWLDEYFSIWASDPGLPFRAAFFDRIWPDTNPPLYFSLLYGVRLFVPDPRLAMTVLNALALALAALATLPSALKSGRLILWSACFAVFLASGPVLRFTAEGRTYLVGLALAFSAAWFAAVVIQAGSRMVSLAAFAAVGMLAALSHVFAALTCGSLAAGLLIAAIFSARKDLVGRALALGLSSGVTTLLWMAFALRHADNISWIHFNASFMKATFWEIRYNLFGGAPGLIPAAGLVALALAMRATRPLAVAFLTASALIVVLPLVASLKIPMVAARYWLIGAPLAVVFLGFVAAASLSTGGGVVTLRAMVAGGLSALLVILSVVGGWRGAVALVGEKPLWIRGADIVRAEAQDCGPQSISVLGLSPLYAYAARLPEEQFRSVSFSKPSTPPGACRVIGWAEHLNMPLYPLVAAYSVENAPAEKLLALMHLAVAPEDVEILRHPSGIVVLRRKQDAP